MKAHRLLPLLAVIASATALALPASGAASSHNVVRCTFKNVPGVRTPTVKATIKARDTERGTRFVGKCRTARRLVGRAVAKSPTHKRFVNSGFNCKPKWLSNGGLDIRWRCVYRGADNPTYSLIAFNLHLHS